MADGVVGLQISLRQIPDDMLVDPAARGHDDGSRIGPVKFAVLSIDDDDPLAVF